MDETGTTADATPSVDVDALVDRLAAADQTVAVAECVTGGLVCARLTDVPGASAVLDRGTVPYAYDALRTQVGVEREPLDEHGAVSDPVARQLARRARDSADATWGVSTVGIAGPRGGTDERPVGTVVAGLSYAAPWGSGGSWARAARSQFDGDRRAVREQGAEWALARLASAVAAVEDADADTAEEFDPAARSRRPDRAGGTDSARAGGTESDPAGGSDRDRGTDGPDQ